MPLGSIPSTAKKKVKRTRGELDVVVHTCNPSTWEAEKGGLQVCGQPQLLSEALCNLVRPYFKVKRIKHRAGSVARR